MTSPRGVLLSLDPSKDFFLLDLFLSKRHIPPSLSLPCKREYSSHTFLP